MKKIGLSILTIGCLFMASGDAYGVEQCSERPRGNGQEISAISGNTDGESFSCAGENGGMRNCDALGYVQTAEDCHSTSSTTNEGRLQCPFREDRFYCGGKISETAKKCAMTLQVAGPTIGGIGGLGLPENVTDCTDERFPNIILYNSCITQLCLPCAIAPGTDFCFNNYGQRVYKLTCDTTIDACLDENDVQDEQADATLGDDNGGNTQSSNNSSNPSANSSYNASANTGDRTVAAEEGF